MRSLIRPALFVLLLLPFTGQAQILEGVEYTRVAPQPVETGSKVEVREFFGYGCPHCYTLEPSLDRWLKTLPKNSSPGPKMRLGRKMAWLRPLWRTRASPSALVRW